MRSHAGLIPDLSCCAGWKGGIWKSQTAWELEWYSSILVFNVAKDKEIEEEPLNTLSEFHILFLFTSVNIFLNEISDVYL